ncbi:uncharacterized protein LOC108864297, partial [Galendromus occidentalis]|uniref:Uncharacterized protein LOC108864297 n=1 Tax=Galendromus occidentalis TaxID=34638 RepID=A0AAJ7PAA2_9ACAR
MRDPGPSGLLPRRNQEQEEMAERPGTDEKREIDGRSERENEVETDDVSETMELEDLTSERLERAVGKNLAAVLTKATMQAKLSVKKTGEINETPKAGTWLPAPIQLAPQETPTRDAVLAAPRLKAPTSSEIRRESKPNSERVNKRKTLLSPEKDELEKRPRKIDTMEELMCLVRERIETYVRTKVQGIKKEERPNTDRKVKTFTDSLMRSTDRLEREIVEAIEESFATQKEKIEARCRVTPRCTCERSTQTEKLRGPRSQEGAAQAEEIREKFISLKTVEDMAELAETEWPRDTCSRVSTTKTGIMSNRSTKILIVDPEDKEQRTTNVLEQLEKSSPAIRGVRSLDDGEVASTETNTPSALMRDFGDRVETERRTLIIGKSRGMAKTCDMIEVIQKIALRADLLRTKEDEKILIQIPSTWDAVLTQKLLEICWNRNDIGSHAEISMKTRRTKNTDRAKTNNDPEWKKQRSRNTQGSVIIGIQNESFAEVLMKLRKEVDMESLGVDIRGVKQTEQGLKLRVRERRTGGQTRLAQYIEEHMSMKTHVRVPAQNTILAIYNMDLATSEEEIERTLRKTISLRAETPIKVEKIRTNEKGQRSALVRLARPDADRLLRLERIKIGWEICRIREWQTVAVCYRCQEIGHRAHECKEKETKAKVCYKCGKEGHLTKACEETEVFCQNCQAEGHSKTRAAHAALEMHVQNHGIDICILSEVNKKISEAYGKRDEGWLADETGDSAIWITGVGPQLRVRNSTTSQGLTHVELEDGPHLASCYFSPNKSDEEFVDYLESIQDLIRDKQMYAWIIAGDFNAASCTWGSRRTSRRGYELEEFAATNNLSILNDGESPTFTKGVLQSFIDISLTNRPELVEYWSVKESTEMISDHQPIELHFRTGRQARGEQQPYQKKWRGRDLCRQEFFSKVDSACQEAKDRKTIVDDKFVSELLSAACSASAPQHSSHLRKKKPVYWWTKDIGEARRRCIHARRLFTRARKRAQDNPVGVEVLRTAYKAARDSYQSEILKSKRQKWKELCESVKNDIWGLPYQIIREKIGRRRLKIPREKTDKAIAELFPKGTPFERPKFLVNPTEIPKITTQEVRAAAEKLATGKANGADGIPPEAVKLLMSRWPEIFAEMVDNILATGDFPERWKTAQLILIPKLGKKDAYRPICLLDTTAKAVESILNRRLQEELQDKGALSDSQYGFRPKRSTITALENVYDAVNMELQKPPWRRARTLIVLLDVKNAFNSVEWSVILKNLRSKGISEYLQRTLSSYLKDRHIIDEDGRRHGMTAGVPQGSVLGPTLWNIA